MIHDHVVKMVDYQLDRQVAQKYKDQPLAQDWARICKIVEETGEAINELILFTGQNPRKGKDKEAFERLLYELADTALTPVYALQHFTKDIALTRYIMDKAQQKHLSRLLESAGEHVRESNEEIG